MNEEVIIGLDFGNYYSYTYFIEGMDPDTHTGGELYPLLSVTNRSEGIPSFFYKEEGEPPVVGESACSKVRMRARAKKLLKRHIGETFEMGGETISYKDAATMVIQEVIREANRRLNEIRGVTTNKVSLAYPVLFKRTEQFNTFIEAVEAAELEDGTKLEVVGTVVEPAAAALDYLCSIHSDAATSQAKQHTVLVYDLGGGSFDAAILTVFPQGVGKGDEVLYYNEDIRHGVEDVGGQDFTDVIENLIRDAVMKRNPNKTFNNVEIDAIRSEAEITKRELTKLEKYSPILGALVGEEITITRSMFESASRHLIAKTIDCTKEVFEIYCKEKERLGEDEILWRPEKIILTGGASAMPMVKDALDTLFSGYGYSGNYIVSHSPSSAIACGAARYPIQEYDARRSTGGVVLQHTHRDFGILYARNDESEYFVKTLIPKRSPLPFIPTEFNRSRPKSIDKEMSVFRVYVATVDDPREECIDEDWQFVGELPLYFPGRVGLSDNEERLIIDEFGRLRAQAREYGKPETLKEITINWRDDQED